VYSGPFPTHSRAELGFFHFLKIVTGWLVRRLANYYFYKYENLQQVINTENYENIEFYKKKKRKKEKKT
jgi:hypothetical protein